MVWPNQDYFALTWPRIRKALSNPAMREAIFQIWLNRDYSAYAKVTGESGLTLSDWQPSARMELFIRKDIAAQMWEYGILPRCPTPGRPLCKRADFPSQQISCSEPLAVQTVNSIHHVAWQSLRMVACMWLIPVTIASSILMQPAI